MMGKPWISSMDLARLATISAASAADWFEAGNAVSRDIWPGYRSGDRALALGGSNYAYVANNADFAVGATDDFVLEVLVRPGVVSGSQVLMHKSSGTSDGFIWLLIDDEMRIILRNGTNNTFVTTSGLGLSAGEVVRLRCCYDYDVPEVAFFVWDEEVARANDSVQTGCSIDFGDPDLVIPSGLGTNTARLTLGATDTGTNILTGALLHAGIQIAELDWPWPMDPSNAGGYWKFENSLVDSSGNGHTLTSGGTASYINVPAVRFQQLRLVFTTPVAPTLLFIDRRHNLSNGAKVKLMRGGWFLPPVQEGDTFSVAAGEPVLIELESTPTADAVWWIEIDDPNNADGYLEIPAIWLGSKTTLNRSFNVGSPDISFVPGGSTRLASGGFSSHVTGMPIYGKEVSFRAGSVDAAILDAAISEVAQGGFFLWSEDGSAEMARLVIAAEALPGKELRKPGGFGFKSYKLTLMEVAQ